MIKLDYTETVELGFGHRPKGIILIHEADVYRLVMRSKLPSAERFQDWVVEEVLPTLRENGYYGCKPSLSQLPAPVEVKQLKHELTLANKQLKFEERRKKAEGKLRDQVFKDLTRLTKENEELRNNGEIQRLTKENEELRKQINPLVNDLLQIAIKENERLRNLIKTAYEGL